MAARAGLLLLLAAGCARAVAARPPWARAATATATASSADGAATVAAVCAGVSAAADTEVAQDGTLLTASCEILSNLQVWLAPLLHTGGPLPRGGPSIPARAAAGSSAASASVELPRACRGAAAYPALANPPTCSGPAVTFLLTGGRCELAADGVAVSCLGPALVATAAPPRCAAATGGTLIVDAHCGRPGDPLFSGAESALAGYPTAWGAPVASGAGLAAALAAAGAPARVAAAASVMEQG